MSAFRNVKNSSFKLRYKESAEVYAQTENSFEEICLKFLEVNDMTALRTFLDKKASIIEKSNSKCTNKHRPIKIRFINLTIIGNNTNNCDCRMDN